MKTARGNLTLYRKKRKFTQTPEPGAKRGAKAKGQLHFVIQKHAASHLHYDFRLEMDGVLKSWAVPKDFPTERGQKRLAMQVEDHPLDYANFEGIIPPGNYGAGTVMVWDKGTYTVINGDPLAALEKGKLELILAGKKLKSEWTLVRMKGREEPGKQPWLIIKTGDTIKPLSMRALELSALSARTMRGIARSPAATWKSNRSTK